MTKKNEPGMAYDMKKLNKLFAILSVVFFITVMWVFLDDYMRPWKAIQIKAQEIKRAKLSQKIDVAGKEIDQKKLSELKTQLNEANAKVSAQETDLEKIQDSLKDVAKEIKKNTITKGDYNSKMTETTFKYESAKAHDPASNHTKHLLQKLQEYKILLDEAREEGKAFQAKEVDLNHQAAQLKKALTEAEQKIKDLLGNKELLENAKSTTDFSAVFFLRNMPFIDFLDPTLKIHQIVVDSVTDDRYFQHVPKVDRCTTCHTFIDQVGYEDQLNPFKTHPKLDLMVGINSPHPLKQIGCTTCHGGEGHRVTDFTSVAHMPQNKKQEAEWVKKYGWHEPHKVPQPMFRLQNTEASCIKCHQGAEVIRGTNALETGRRNIEKFGCYACHKIEGWEHKRKPGPSLEKIAGKIDKEFFKSWVWNPQAFNAHSKMPRFFAQSNNSKPEFMIKNIAEVNAIAEYVYSKSKPYVPFAKYTAGNGERGKQLIATIGCLGCHGVEGLEEQSEKVKAYAGPYLTGTGSKVSGDWLVSWLKKPSHYQESTIMPSFRLSDQETSDIATYLLSLKNVKFERLKLVAMDKTARDEILVGYLKAFDTLDNAKAKVAKMSDQEKTLDLGFRSVGKYGCYSCHNVEGFDGRAPIGPELTKEGSKPLTQFDFAHQPIEQSKESWLYNHLLNPRRWDATKDASFEDLNRMPNFYMSGKDAEAIVVTLLGQVSDRVPLKGIRRPGSGEARYEEGLKVIGKYNCMGCHNIDGMRGDIRKMYEDANEAPPSLMNQGHRVQAAWLNHFLDNVHSIRPWLNIRMPSFNLSNEEKNIIIAGFQGKAEQVTFENLPAKPNWEPGEREQAIKLFNNLNCVSCHSIGFTKDQPSAPDLHYVKHRMRAGWVDKWLTNPQAILDYTPMPNFWQDGVSTDTETFAGDPVKQRKALVKYLQEIGYDRYPNGNL